MKKATLALLLIFTAFNLLAQVAVDKAKMERERQAIQKELQEIQGKYNQVKGQKKETIGQLTILQKKMTLQNQYVSNINKEIRLINDDIFLSAKEVNKLKQQLDTLKEQYSRSVVYAYKNRSAYDYLNFIFSASTFNDALKRISYLKSYRQYRQQQVTNIVQTQKLIEDRRQQLVSKKTQKSSALQNQTQQLKVLEDQKKEKDVVISKLKSKESELSKQMAAKKKRDNQLKGQIAAMIRREIETAKKEAAKKEAEERARLAKEKAANTPANTETAKTTTPNTPTKTAAPKKENSYLTLNAKDIALNSSFQNNRGKLPWPVDNGVVSIPYGTYTVPGTSLKGENNCLTISTPSSGATVKAVFDGEVTAVSNIGDGYVVMIRHGKYFTVYSGLGSASVSRGTVVKTGQAIGRSGPADDGSGGQMDFYLMIESKEVNPEPWLR